LCGMGNSFVGGALVRTRGVRSEKAPAAYTVSIDAARLLIHEICPHGRVCVAI
jgi:hypothetical protein